MSGSRNPRTRRANARIVSIQIDAAGINDVLKDMNAISAGVRTRMVKRTLRDWGRMVAKAAKRGVTWRSRKLKRNIIQKVTSYPKGASGKRTRRIWVGVGVKRFPGGIREDVGARAHFYEKGWSPWPKGRPTVRTWGLGMSRKERAELKRRIDKYPGAFLDLGPKRQGNYRGQPASRMRQGRGSGGRAPSTAATTLSTHQRQLYPGGGPSWRGSPG